MMDSIENRLSDFLPKFIHAYLKLMSALKEKSHGCNIVDIHKNRLGNPDRLWIGGSERRKFAVWQMGDLTILVHKEKGVVLEVPQSASPSKAWKLWRQYQKAMTGTNS